MKNQNMLWLLIGAAALYFFSQKSAGAAVVLPTDIGPHNPDTDICNSLSPNYDIAACYSAGRTPYAATLSTSAPGNYVTIMPPAYLGPPVRNPNL